MTADTPGDTGSGADQPRQIRLRDARELMQRLADVGDWKPELPQQDHGGFRRVDLSFLLYRLTHFGMPF